MMMMFLLFSVVVVAVAVAVVDVVVVVVVGYSVLFERALFFCFCVSSPKLALLVQSFRY